MSGTVSLGHFDGASTDDGVKDMLTDLISCCDASESLPIGICSQLAITLYLKRYRKKCNPF